MILNRSQLEAIRQEKASNRMSSVRARAVHVPNLLDTIIAQTAALEAWADWWGQEKLVDKPPRTLPKLADVLAKWEHAVKLTEAAGIDWPQEGEA